MTQDIQQGHIEPPAARMPTLRSLLLWAALGVAVLLLVAFGLASHRPGVPTVTPGHKVPTASETALNNIGSNLQALPIAHPKASTRQADAKG